MDEKAIIESRKALSRERQEEVRAQKRAEVERIAEKRKKKEENEEKSIVGQVISNPNTIRRMGKKQLKQLIKR